MTCSCSGLLEAAEFEAIAHAGAARAGRSLQVLTKGGAGVDHPKSDACPELNYLKVIWARITDPEKPGSGSRQKRSMPR